MPTPRPIIAAKALVKEGKSTKAARTVIKESPVPRAISAVTIGRPIATTEPKAIKRMIIAARRPKVASVFP